MDTHSWEVTTTFFRFIYVQVNGYISGRGVGYGGGEGGGGGAYTSFIFDSFTLRQCVIISVEETTSFFFFCLFTLT